MGVIMTHKVCTISKFSASGWSLVTPSTKLWKYMNFPDLYDGFSIIFQELLENLSLIFDLVFSVSWEGGPVYVVSDTVWSVVHLTLSVQVDKNNSFFTGGSVGLPLCSCLTIARRVHLNTLLFVEPWVLVLCIRELCVVSLNC